jgi:hypothetical protein
VQMVSFFTVETSMGVLLKAPVLKYWGMNLMVGK